MWRNLSGRAENNDERPVLPGMGYDGFSSFRFD